MNQRHFSVARRPIAVASLLLADLALISLTARGQPPVVIPPGTASPIAVAGQSQTTDFRAVGPYYKVTGVDDHLKMVVNSSRFLTLEKRIPQVQVNNPDVLDVVPISPNQVQVSAKRTGVTQVNLWGEDKRIYTVTVIVMGDAAELTEVLRQLFPKTSLTIVPVNGNSVIISGYVDQQDALPKIVAIAQKYFPDVINNMRVSGAQQGLLHVKVYEVSRTKLRNMGFDWATVTSGGNVFFSGVSGLLTTATAAAPGQPATFAAPDNLFKFSIAGANAFYGVLNAMRQDGLSKLLSEPDLVAISGRPAYMLVGGELGYTVQNGTTGPVSGFKEYGTRLDFVPLVLGNGRMHIDVRARVSEPDAANTSAGGVPSITTREVETGVELRAGQTLAIAGLIQQRVEANNQGIPWISEIPYLGFAFRMVSHQTNEIELLIMVTPEIVDGMEPGQVPPCLPGMQTADPSDWELFFKGHLEVPNCCPDPAVCRNPAVNGVGAGSNPGESPVSRQDPQNRARTNATAMHLPPPEPAFIGPVGYDVVK